MIEKDILFIFGAPRSGTTYVNALVREFFDYGLASEANFVLEYPSRLEGYGDLNESKNLERLVNDLCTDPFLEHFRVHYSKFLGRPVNVTADDVLYHVVAPSFAGVVYGVFAAVAQQMGCSRVGNKNPAYSSCLPQLFQWFPRAKFMHVVRDGRDVALSLMKEAWGEKSAYSCAKKWLASLENASQFKALVPVDQYFEIYYERLLQQPESVLDELEQFLGVRLEPPDKHAFVSSITNSEMRSNFDKWRTKMSANQLRVFEAVAAQSLANYGYASVCDAPRVSAVERVAYQAGDIGRKVQLTLRTWAFGVPD